LLFSKRFLKFYLWQPP